MMVEASRIPPIHQRKFEIGLRAGEPLLPGVVIAGSVMTCLRSAACSGVRMVELQVKVAHNGSLLSRIHSHACNSHA
jgi:hypothetical protein